MSEYITKKKRPYITKKIPEYDLKLEDINKLLKEKTKDANEMFKMKTYKKGGLVKKGKPKLAKKGWK